MEELKQYIPAIITAILFLWSEYLGLSKKHKSNAIIELLICALSSKDAQPQDIELPPAVIAIPPAESRPPSS
jgi:hypothetical protein